MTPFKKGDYYTPTCSRLQPEARSVGWFKSAVVAPDFQAARDAGTTELPMNCDVTPRAANIFEVGLGYATDTGPRTKFGWKKHGSTAAATASRPRPRSPRTSNSSTSPTRFPSSLIRLRNTGSPKAP